MLSVELRALLEAHKGYCTKLARAIKINKELLILVNNLELLGCDCILHV